MTVDDLELELRRLPGVRAAGFTERDGVLLVQVQVTGHEHAPNIGLQATRIAYRHSDLPVAVEVVRWRTPGTAPAAPSSAEPPAVAAEPPVAAAPSTEAAPAGPGGATPAPSNGDIIGGDDAPGPAPSPPASPGEVPVHTAASRHAPDAPEGEDSTIDATAENGGAVPGESRDARVRLLAVLTFPDTDELEVHLTYSGRRSIGRAVASRGVLGAVEATVAGLETFVPDIEFLPSWARPMDDADGRPSYLVACALTAPGGGNRYGIAAGASPIEAAARATLHALNRSIARALVESAAS
jgi:hypothetical protein